jgi:hypothetical protein
MSLLLALGLGGRVLLVDLGFLAGLLVGAGGGRPSRRATLRRCFGVGRWLGERLPDVAEEVGEAHGCCEGAIGWWRGVVLQQCEMGGRELGEVAAGIAKSSAKAQGCSVIKLSRTRLEYQQHNSTIVVI